MLNIPAKIGALSNSCTGGLDAIASAYAALQRGQAEIALCGGTDAVIIPSVVTGLGFAGLLSTTSENPVRASRPFDLLRTGGILGEGAGVLVLETLEHANARGTQPYAEIIGYNLSCDYLHGQQYGFQQSMQGCLMNANCMPEDISYISAHGSSDMTLDQMETDAIKAAFGKHAHGIPVTSVKGVTANPLAAGGAIQVVAACLMCSEALIPPTANLEVPDPACDLDYVPHTPRRHTVDIAMVNSRGIGGVNSSLLLRNCH
jgi:3-oxoacyl-[acyl-carrier-protein] synthase II